MFAGKKCWRSARSVAFSSKFVKIAWNSFFPPLPFHHGHGKDVMRRQRRAVFTQDVVTPFRLRPRLWLIALGFFVLSSLLVHADEIDSAIATLKKIEASNEGNQLAVPAIRQLQTASPSTLLRVLEGMKNASPIGKNYLSGAAGALYGRDSASLKTQLESFLNDKKQDGEARYLVFQWLTDQQPELREQMLETMREDPSLELRFDAIALALQKLDKSTEAAPLQALLDSARHPDQIETIAKKLQKAGQEVDQAQVFGFLMKWQIIGPFDNRDQKHFDTVYDVEKDLIFKGIDASKKYPGKSGQVAWQEYNSEDAAGIVDLAKPYSNEKGAIAYAHAIYSAKQASEVEFRLGCINANKLWVNGQLVLMNEVYHAGMSIDQYIGRAKLKAGDNAIVLKICQNEQTESWAQRWQFQLRVSDETGKAILAQNR
jgi:hypothetical protein